MSGRDVAQLILEVDARIATAQRAVNQLAKSIQSDSTNMERSLDRVSRAHANIGKAMNDNNGRLRAGFTQLSFQIGDVSQQMALGVNASRIFAQQSGQVIQALQVMGGEGNRFLQFMGGPWGIAISTAAVILAPFAGKLFDTGDETQKLTDKMKKQADEAVKQEAANKIWAQSIDGVREAQKKLRDELEQSLKVESITRQQNLDNAQERLNEQRNRLSLEKRNETRLTGEVAAARADVKGVLGSGSPEAIQEAQGRLSNLEAQLQKSRETIAQLQRDIDASTATITAAQISIANASADASSSASSAIQQQADALKGAVQVAAQFGRVTVDAAERARIAINDYTEAEQNAAQQGVKFATVGASRHIEALTESFRKGKLDVATYVAELNKATKALNDAAKAAADAKKGGGQFGRQIGFAEAEQIARAAGLQVNSGYRSPADQARLYNDPSVNRPGNPVARPGTSAHNGANGKWAIDIQITDGVTPGSIRKIFADQGVSLTKVFKEKGHFHVEGSRSEAAKAEAATIHLDNAFEEKRDQLNQELLRAQTSLVQGIDAQADAAEATLRAEQSRRDAAIQNDVEEGKLTQAQADQLKAINATITFEKMKAVEVERQVRHIQEQDEQQQRRFDYQLDDLRFADEMARTQAEHRRIQLQILDILYQEKRAHLENLKSIALTNGDQKQANDIQAQIDRLPREKAHDQARTLRGTMNPLEQWANQVPKTAAEINEALQSIEARGLDSLSNALTDVIMGTKSLGQAFSDVSRQIIGEIIQMTIRMLIFKAISSAFGMGSGGSGGGGPITYAAKGGIFSSGRLVPFATGGIVGGPTVFPMAGGRTGLMGEAGPEAILPLGRDSMGRLGVRATNASRAANSNAPVELVIYSAASDDAWARVEAISANSAGQAVKLSVNHTNTVLRQMARPKLNSR